MRALKALVIVMAMLILGGAATLAVVIAGHLSRGGPGSTPVLAQPFTASPIELPAGARIEAMSMAEGRLALALLLPSGNRQLVILDIATGRRLGAIPLGSAP